MDDATPAEIRMKMTSAARGRPKKKGGVYPVSAVRIPPEIGAAVDQWANAQPETPTRSEAIRRLVEFGLRAKGK
jgi:hypothetical protein